MLCIESSLLQYGTLYFYPYLVKLINSCAPYVDYSFFY